MGIFVLDKSCQKHAQKRQTQEDADSDDTGSDDMAMLRFQVSIN